MSERVVVPDDAVDDIAEMLEDVDEPYARVTVKGVTADQHIANLKLAAAVADADGCLNCGKDTDGAAYCNLNCLEEWGIA